MRSMTLICVLLMLSALGCSSDHPTTQAAASPGPAAAAVSTPASAQATAAPPAAPTVASPEHALQPKGSRPVATADATISGIRVDVTELKRSSGGTLTLKFVIVNDSGRALTHADIGIGTGSLMVSGYAIDGVHLIDPVGKKKYFVAKDAAGGCVCSQFAMVPAGGRANHWAKFAAPPDGVERISVVIPFFAPLDDVPVTR